MCTYFKHILVKFKHDVYVNLLQQFGLRFKSSRCFTSSNVDRRRWDFEQNWQTKTA